MKTAAALAADPPQEEDILKLCTKFSNLTFIYLESLFENLSRKHRDLVNRL